MKQKMQIGLIALSVLILGFVVFTFPFFNKLVLETREGKFLKVYSLNEGDYFEITFRHSVNKGLITERYQLDRQDGTIFLKYGWFENYGAGMMDTIEPNMKMTQDGDRLRIEFAQNKVENVKFASAGIANHNFIYGDNKVNFFENYPYKTITIGIKKLSIKEIIR